MNILKAVPQLRGARLVAAIVAGVAVVGVLVWLAWSVFIAPGKATRAVADANATATVQRGEAAKAADARPIIERTHDVIRTTQTLTFTNERLIRAAPGAGDAVAAGVDRAGRAAICLRDVYRADPACQQLPRADPAQLDGADAGRGAAAR